jgi:hypothetical protein
VDDRIGGIVVAEGDIQKGHGKLALSVPSSNFQVPGIAVPGTRNLECGT